MVVILVRHLEANVSVVLRIEYQLKTVFLNDVVRQVGLRVVWTRGRGIDWIQADLEGILDHLWNQSSEEGRTQLQTWVCIDL